MLENLWRLLVLYATLTFVVPVVVAGSILAGLLFLPLPATLPEPKPAMTSQASSVYDAEGNLIAVFKAFEQTSDVKRGDLPKILKDATVASEDRSFWTHGGVDPRGTLRALWVDVRGGHVQGGSTITQQYVKNSYTGGERSISRKVREAVLASRIDRQVDKEEILYRYLTTIYLGEGSYGVGAAAENYFRKQPKNLTVAEAATLVGIIPAPSRYSPRVNPELAEQRRRTVLSGMAEQGYITEQQYIAALNAPLKLSPTPLDPTTATTVYPRASVQTRHPYFVDYVRRYVIDAHGEDALYRGGLKIQTTLDPRMQEEANLAAERMLHGIPSLPPIRAGDAANNMQLSIVSVEPASGYVKAIVGGRDVRSPSSDVVNLALGRCPTRPTNVTIQLEASCWEQAKPIQGGGSGRQPGSTFKAFTLAAAFEKNIPVTTQYPAPDSYAPPGCVGDCRPIRNAADGEGGGRNMTLADATSHSVNTVYAELAHDVGNPAIAGVARKLGVTSAWYSPQRHGASYTLGAQEVSTLDMAASYSVFANRGQRNPATPIFRITGPNGQVKEDHSTPSPQRVLTEPVADNVTGALIPVLTTGTAKGRDIGRPAAGKTGTTDDYVDAWFVGYTPALSTAVWMGYDRQVSMRNVKGVPRVFGGTLPAEIWQGYMRAALNPIPPSDFNQPAPIQRIEEVRAEEAAKSRIDPGDRRYPAPGPTVTSVVPRTMPGPRAPAVPAAPTPPSPSQPIPPLPPNPPGRR